MVRGLHRSTGLASRCLPSYDGSVWTAGVTFYFWLADPVQGGTMLRAFSRGLVPVLLMVVSVTAADGPVIKFSDVKLKNGLRVIISEDHTAPTVSVAVTYNVGSA